MADLQRVRLQLLDKETGAVLSEVDVLTSPSAVLFEDGKNLTQKLSEIELTPGAKGDKGDIGAPFQIKKIYPSIAEMNASYATDEVAIGEFVLINNDNVDDTDNSKLYCKTDTQYGFITDLSGAQGIVGPAGRDGIDGTNGADGANGKDGINGKDGGSVKVGTDLATAVEQSLFLKVVS